MDRSKLGVLYFSKVCIATPCSQLDKYVLWVEEFMNECETGLAVAADQGGWYDYFLIYSFQSLAKESFKI